MNESNSSLESCAVHLFRSCGVKVDDYRLSILPGGNNRVYLVDTNIGRYVLKQYFGGVADKRDRLASEYRFLEFAWKKGVHSVPKPFACDDKNRLALYQYIEGVKLLPGQVSDRHVDMAADFICDLNKKEHRCSTQARKLPMASDFYSSEKMAVISVDSRIKRLLSIPAADSIDEQAGRFIKNVLVPEWNRIKTALANHESYEDGIDKSELILSPSDFGFHNALVDTRGRACFIDFEYAGWDDPVKLICDFFCQPAVPVPVNYLGRFTDKINMLLQTERNFNNLIEQLLPLFRVKWCCIMLNDFLPSDSKRKIFANYENDTRLLQLEKVKLYADENL